MNSVKDFIEDELCAHEGGIIGVVSFGYDDATFNYIVSVGSEYRNNVKVGRGRSLGEAITDFKTEHRMKDQIDEKLRRN
tara:strand:+ start:169 stop:405 length:237 start_codon:yes stop_codon:yes gene_type:complete